MSLKSLSLNDRCEFSVYANSILGSNFRGAKLINKLSFEGARRLGYAVGHLSTQVYPNLPKGTPSDAKTYDFYEFELNGKLFVLAEYWIIDSSVKRLESLDYEISIRNTTPEVMAKVRDQLRMLRLDFTISG